MISTSSSSASSLSFLLVGDGEELWQNPVIRGNNVAGDSLVDG